MDKSCSHALPAHPFVHRHAITDGFGGSLFLKEPNIEFCPMSCGIFILLSTALPIASPKLVVAPSENSVPSIIYSGLLISLVSINADVTTISSASCANETLNDLKNGKINGLVCLTHE